MVSLDDKEIRPCPDYLIGSKRDARSARRDDVSAMLTDTCVTPRSSQAMPTRAAPASSLAAAVERLAGEASGATDHRERVDEG